MRRFRSIRVWLAATLTLVSVLTALAVAVYVLPAADSEFGTVSSDAALGQVVNTAHDIAVARSPDEIRAALRARSRQAQLSLWLVGADRRTLASSALPGLTRESLPGSNAALDLALRGGRSLPTETSSAPVVGLPVNLEDGSRAALIAYVPEGGVASRASGALRSALLRGTLVAVVVALALSVVAASFVARRVRRLASAAERIAEGDFETPVRRGLMADEIGSLALSIDEMRVRLAGLFSTLAHERRRLAVVVDSLEEGVVALDARRRVQLANPSAARLLGVPLETGEPIRTDGALDLTAVLHEAEQGRRAEQEGRTENGCVLALQTAPLGQSDQAGTLLVVVDRTSEREREEVERRFIANASHELRTPLSAIVAAVEVLESGAKDDLAARDAFLADLHREASRLQRLTDTLLTLARLGTGELRAQEERVEVGDAARHVAQMMGPLAAAGRVALVAAGDAEALADADLLEQALLGLVANALKHTPAGGRVDLLVTHPRGGPRIVIADTGPGIAQGDLLRAFDRFWRADDSRRDGGFGLGLGICQEFVEAMGGVLDLESAPGQGTVATILLEEATPHRVASGQGGNNHLARPS